MRSRGRPSGERARQRSTVSGATASSKRASSCMARSTRSGSSSKRSEACRSTPGRQVAESAAGIEDLAAERIEPDRVDREVAARGGLGGGGLRLRTRVEARVPPRRTAARQGDVESPGPPGAAPESGAPPRPRGSEPLPESGGASGGDAQHLEIEIARRVPQGRVPDTSSSEEGAPARRCDVLTQGQQGGERVPVRADAPGASTAHPARM